MMAEATAPLAAPTRRNAVEIFARRHRLRPIEALPWLAVIACFFAFRALLLDTFTHEEYIPQNEGSFRPVKVTSPLGSIFNPISPVAAEARFSQIQRLCDLIIKALAPVLPDKCTAGNAAVLSFAAYSGVRPNGDYWVFLEVNEAAMGGRPFSDGPDTVEELMRNTRNNPLEDLGMHLPLICDRYEVRDDVPPGAGKFRGGAGVVKSQRYLTPGFMTHESDRNEDAPWGIFGGKPGHGSKVELKNTLTGEISYQPQRGFTGTVTFQYTISDGRGGTATATVTVVVG